MCSVSGNAEKTLSKYKLNSVHFRRPTLCSSNRFPSSLKINCHIHSFFSEMWSVRRHVVTFSSISVGKHWKVFSRRTWTEYAPSDLDDLPRQGLPKMHLPFFPPELHHCSLVSLLIKHRIFPGKIRACEGGLLLKEMMKHDALILLHPAPQTQGKKRSDGLITRWKSKMNVSVSEG